MNSHSFLPQRNKDTKLVQRLLAKYAPIQKIDYLLLIIVFTAFFTTEAHSQDSLKLRTNTQISDSTPSPKKTIKKRKPTELDSFPSPKKALLFSFIPGGGQIYNNKQLYLRLPIVYGGFAIGVYQIVVNNNAYSNLKLNYTLKLNNKPLDTSVFPNIEGATADAIKQTRDNSFKNLQLAYVFTTVWYVLSGVEAFTTAHLAHFDVKDDIGINFKPALIDIPAIASTGAIGLTMQINFR